MFDDLREFIKRADELGWCKTIKGADWDLEISRICELSGSMPNQPMLLFDNIKDYPPGFRVAMNHFNTFGLFALAYDLPLEASGVELVKAWRQKLKKGFTPVPPVEVSTGSVEENVY